MREPVSRGSSEARLRKDETAALEEYLRSRLGGRVRVLQIVVRAEGLVLRGWTRSFYVKQLAQHAVMEFTCVPILANEIRVD